MEVYRVERKDGRVAVYAERYEHSPEIIRKADQRVAYSAPEDTHLVFKAPVTGGVQTSVVKELSDEDLLIALANKITL